MTADIRTAAQREAKRIYVPAWFPADHLRVDLSPLARDHFVLGAVWAAARVTPTREQIAKVLDEDRYYDPDLISNLDRAGEILALMQELAEVEI